MTKPSHQRTPAEDDRLLVKQADRLGVPVPKKQRRCAEGGAPCRRASCYSCRHRYSKAIMRVLRARYVGKQVQMLTVAVAVGRYDLGDSASFKLHDFRNQVRRKLKRKLPIGTEIVGWLDVSYNLHNNADRRLQYHYHAIIYPPLSERAKRRVSACFKRDRKYAKKPVVFRAVAPDKLADRLNYVFKWFYQRRSSFDDFIGDDGEEVRTSPKKQEMQRPERLAVHQSLLKNKVDDLVFLVGAKRAGKNKLPSFEACDLPT